MAVPNVTIVVQIIQKLSLYFGRKCKFVVVEMVATAKYISIVSIFITTKQKTIETAELDFSIVSIVFDSQSENYCNY